MSLYASGNSVRAKLQKKRKTGRDIRFPQRGDDARVHIPPCFLFVIRDVDVAAVILEKIVFQNYRYFLKQGCVDAFAFEDAVDVCPVAA